MNITEKLENTVQEAVKDINKLEKFPIEYAIETSEKSIIIILYNALRDCFVIVKPDEQDNITSRYIFNTYFQDGE